MNNDQRTTPHSASYEKQVLSVLMRAPHRIGEEALTEGHFFIPAHKTIFQRVKAATCAEDCDLVNMAQTLHDRGELEHVGGPAMLAEIYGHATHDKSFSKHVGELRDRKARREMIAKATQVISSCYEIGGDDGSFEQYAREGFTDALETLAGASGGPNTKTIIKERLDAFLARIQGVEKVQGIPTCAELDYHIHGLHPGRMTVIGAYPSGGKSVLSSQILVDAAISGVPCLYLPLEMTPGDLVDRALIQASFISTKEWSFPDKPTQAELNKVRRGVQKLGDAPFYLDKARGNRLDTIVAKIRSNHRRHGIQLVCVDYAQLIRVPGMYSELQAITEASHTLKALAEELEIHVILPTQLNAEGDTKNGRVIEEDADTWVSILQDMDKDSDTYKQHQGLRIDKDRHYGNGGNTVGVMLNKDKIRFESGQLPEKKTKKKGRW